jgi:hypothetical protein
MTVSIFVLNGRQFHTLRDILKLGITPLFSITEPLLMLVSDPIPNGLLQLNAPSFSLPVPLHRSPRRQEGNMDIFQLPTNDDILQYLVDVAMEVRNHMGATHAHRSSIKKQLLDVLDLARKLQVICIFEDPFFQNNTGKFTLGAM